MGGRLVSPIFIGRGEALADAADLLRRTASGRASTLLVAGEAGIGKTRFAEAVADLARSQRFQVLRGGCVQLGSGEFPYAPIAEALRGLTRRLDPGALGSVVADDADLLARIAPSLGPRDASRADTEPSEAARGRLLEALLGLLVRLSHGAPVLLVVEDLHWADSATLDTLSFLIRSLRDEAVGLLLTFRSDELHRRHPLRRWLGEIERLGTVARLDLGQLGRDDIGALIRAIRDEEPSPDLIARIADRSDGNPFFVEELVAAEGNATARGQLPPSLRDVLLARIETIPDDAHVLLDVAAVAGRAVDPELLGQASGLAPAVFDSALSACVERRLLVVDRAEGRDRLAFRHALVAEVVDDALLPDRRIHLHRAVADVLAARLAAPAPAEPGRWAELAGHWDAAREESRVLDAALRAAGEAVQAYAFAAALTQYLRAIAAWESVHDAPSIAGFDHIELLQRAADVAGLGASPVQIRLLREAVDEADRVGDVTRGSLLRGGLGVALWIIGEPVEASRLYREAVSLMPPGAPTAERAWLRAGLGRILMLDGQLIESREACELAIAMAREVGDRTSEGNALNTLAADLADLGRGELAASSLERSLELALELGNPEEIGRAYSNGIELLATSGREDRAYALIEVGSERSSATGTWISWGTAIHLHAGVMAYDLGRWAEAASFFRSGEALKELRPQDEAYALSHIVPLQVGTGRQEAAASTLARLGELLGRFDTEYQYTGPAACAAAELALWQGRPGEALAAIDEALARIERTDDARYRMRLLRLGTGAAADLAAVGRDRKDAAVTAEALERAATLRQRSTAAVAAIAGMDGGLALELAAEEATVAAEETRLRGRSDPGGWQEAADRWSARQRPYQRAYARYRQAEASLAEGDRLDATEALTEAGEIASTLGARPLLEEIESLGRRGRITVALGVVSEASVSEADEGTALARKLGLTPREREVLGLLAQGLTNRQIADSLYISIYTAGIHVSRILGKLEVASRTEAASKAYRLGLVAR